MLEKIDNNIPLSTLRLVLGEADAELASAHARYEHAWPCGCTATEGLRETCIVRWCEQHARTIALAAR